MKKPAIHLYLRPNKAKDKAFLNVRYTYDRKSFPIPLGCSIKKEDWDAKRQRMHFHAEGSVEVNRRIKETIAILEFISNSLISENKVPTVAMVKDAFISHALKLRKESLQKNYLDTRELKLLALRSSTFYKEALNDYELAVRRLNIATELEKEAKKKAFELTEVLKVNKEICEFTNSFPKDRMLHVSAEELEKVTQIAAQHEVAQESEDTETKQFTGLLLEYIEEKTGIGLSASKEQIRAVKRATTGSNRGLRSWAKTLVEFTNSKHVRESGLHISLHHLSKKFYDTYAAFLMEPDGHNIFNNTFGQHIKKLKRFLKWVERDRKIQVDSRYNELKELKEEKEIIHLTIEDINQLYEFTPDEGRKHADANSWRKYIDFTVFSFLTSLRISDIKRVQGFRFENGYIMGKTKKTNGNFKIPMNLDPRIEEILKRYDYNMLLFSDVEYNRTIKELLKLFLEKYGLYQRPITITRFKHIEPDPIVTTHSFYDLYTSHCNRKGWVSYMSDRGFDDFTLMEMMGTKSHHEFLKYKKNKVSHLTERVYMIEAFEAVVKRRHPN